MKRLTLASLFDGSGGFPLAGMLAGIVPVWASEIEPFPVRVTTKRMPFVKHYGDVSAINGAEVEPVDIITFGSPCQDMSVAGKRAGIAGARSGLFYEAIRIIEEMREATNGEKPRWCVWENVTGAYSSNGGEDFRSVLEAVAGVKDRDARIPGLKKWEHAGLIMGGSYSIAWRTLDAQYWGVPQRRKRIFLVADFNGGSAGKVLFKSEGVSGYSAEGFEAWKGTARDTEGSAGAAGSICLNDQGGERMDVSGNISGILRAQDHGHPPVVMAAGFCTEPSAKTRSIGYEDETSPTLRAGVVPAAIALEHHPTDSRIRIEEGDAWNDSDAMYTLNATEHHGVAAPVYHGTKNSHLTRFTDDPALDTLVATEYKEPPVVSVEPYYIVRRLTPTECARLQGFPDWWCDDLGTDEPTEEELKFWAEVFETHRRIVTGASKSRSRAQIIKWLKNPHTDGAEYKMWGNGVALPCVEFVLSGIAREANNETEEQDDAWAFLEADKQMSIWDYMR